MSIADDVESVPSSVTDSFSIRPPCRYSTVDPDGPARPVDRVINFDVHGHVPQIWLAWIDVPFAIVDRFSLISQVKQN